MSRIHVLLAAAGLALLACSSATSSTDTADGESVASSSSALTTSDAVARAEQWASVKLHYCQAPNHGRDYDSACSTYCNRTSNAAWDPYRSDCSGLVSWAWGLSAPGRVTTQFAPFQNDITHAIAATDLRAGDAVNNSEHVMLFKAWLVKDKRAVFIEEPGCSSAQPYAHETTSDVTINGSSIHVAYNGMTFTAIRYTSLKLPVVKAPAPATPPPQKPGAANGAAASGATAGGEKSPAPAPDGTPSVAGGDPSLTPSGEGQASTAPGPSGDGGGCATTRAPRHAPTSALGILAVLALVLVTRLRRRGARVS